MVLLRWKVCHVRETPHKCKSEARKLGEVQLFYGICRGAGTDSIRSESAIHPANFRGSVICWVNWCINTVTRPSRNIRPTHRCTLYVRLYAHLMQSTSVTKGMTFVFSPYTWRIKAQLPTHCAVPLCFLLPASDGGEKGSASERKKQTLMKNVVL